MTNQVLTGRDLISFAEQERENGNHASALFALMQGISHSPSPEARLLLVRVLCESDCAPYALRELAALLSDYPALTSLQKLYRALGGEDSPWERSLQSKPTSSELVATAEIDLDALEELAQEIK
jgi:hypothetical protein